MSERTIKVVATVTYVAVVAGSYYLQYALSKKACKDALREHDAESQKDDEEAE